MSVHETTVDRWEPERPDIDLHRAEQALAQWEQVQRKILRSGQISVAPLIAVMAAAVLLLVAGRTELLGKAVALLFGVPMWLPVAAAAAETFWVVWMKKCIRRLDEQEMRYLDEVKPYKERDYSRRGRGGEKAVPYKKVLSELMVLFYGWNYVACFFWFIGSYGN